jgi:hypothetical protein
MRPTSVTAGQIPFERCFIEWGKIRRHNSEYTAVAAPASQNAEGIPANSPGSVLSLSKDLPRVTVPHKNHNPERVAALIRTLFILTMLAPVAAAAAEPLEWARVSDDRTHFVARDSGKTIQLWGVNYDHDGAGRLLEDYWRDEWPRVVEDFREIKALGANSVRLHVQLGRFMESAEKPDSKNLAQLSKLIALAEKTQLYLIITGLGCYHKQDIPPWYDKLSERERWEVQARFWQAVANVAKDSPAVFSYDLMNEPVAPGGNKVETDWLAKPLGDKHFVQRIALDPAGRTQKQIAKAWVETLAAAIREVDKRHMITVGVIPWALTWPNAKPLFYSPEVGEPLDYVSVHFYPKAGEVQKALDALRVYEVGKPLVIEEIFPLQAGNEDVLDFIKRSQSHADGWVSFYWGDTIDQCERKKDFGSAMMAAWLKEFRKGPPAAEPSAPRE